MIVYLVLNQQKAEARRVAEQAAGILEQCGAQAIWPDSDPERDSALLAKANAVLTIGGDGTILHTARRTRLHGISILGINLGRVGFLATCEIEEMPVKLARLARGDFQLDRRTLLRAVCNGWEQVALNDVVLYKGWRMQTIEFAVWCDGTLVNRYRGDGVIVATPTGSTAYSLSCGGPIVAFDCDNLIITPVSPHNLNMRPLILPGNVQIRLKVESRSGDFMLSADSRMQRMSDNHELFISSGDFKMNVVKMPDHSYYDTLRNKLNWGEDKRNKKDKS